MAQENTKGLTLIHPQPLRLLSGKRESDAKPAQEHKTCAIVTNLETQGWRKTAQGWRKIALGGARPRRPAQGLRKGCRKSRQDSLILDFLYNMRKLVIFKTNLL